MDFPKLAAFSWHFHWTSHVYGCLCVCAHVKLTVKLAVFFLFCFVWRLMALTLQFYSAARNFGLSVFHFSCFSSFSFLLQFIIKLQFGMRAKKLTALPGPKTIRGMSEIFLELACVLVIRIDMAKIFKIIALYYFAKYGKNCID